MTEYIAKYSVSKNYRRIGEIDVRYTANGDDESIRIARSVCDKLGEKDVEELIIEKIVSVTSGAVNEDELPGNIASAIISTLTSHIIDSVITKVIYSKKYPCIRPRPLDDLYKYIDIERLEEIVNER